MEEKEKEEGGGEGGGDGGEDFVREYQGNFLFDIKLDLTV